METVESFYKIYQFDIQLCIFIQKEFEAFSDNFELFVFDHIPLKSFTRVFCDIYQTLKASKVKAQTQSSLKLYGGAQKSVPA